MLTERVTSAQQVDAEDERESHLLRLALSKLRRERDDLAERLKIATAVDQAALQIPRWVRAAPPKGTHHGIVCAVLSDTHYGETINPAEVDYINAYNPKIAERRTRTYFEKVLMMARDYTSGIAYDGMVLFLAGDMVSGTIHEETTETNAETTAESIVHWLGPLEAGINMLAADLGHVLVPCVVGNHGRNTTKPRAKRRARDNNDWLLYKLLQRDFRGRDDVQIMVSDAADLQVPVYKTKFQLHHGDQYRGGSGISAMLSPLMLGHHRKTQRQTTVGRPFDWEVMGHWHNYWHGMGIIVSGALKGVDEYAYIGNFRPDRPQLAWWITTPERGIVLSGPIEPMDRKAEGW